MDRIVANKHVMRGQPGTQARRWPPPCSLSSLVATMRWQPGTGYIVCCGGDKLNTGLSKWDRGSELERRSGTLEGFASGFMGAVTESRIRCSSRVGTDVCRVRKKRDRERTASRTQ